MNKNTLRLLLVFMPLIVFLVYQVIERNKKLKDFDIVCCQVYEVYLNQRKGVTSNKNVANYKYSYQGHVYDRSSEFYTFDVKAGDFFQVKVSKKDPFTHSVYFGKKSASCADITK